MTDDEIMALLHRCAHDDEAAWSAMYSEFHALSMAWARSVGSELLDDALCAEDFVVDGWTAFARRVKAGGVAFETPGKMLAYLRACIQSKVIERARRIRPGGLLEMTDYDRPCNDPLKQVCDRERIAWSWQHLSPIERRIFAGLAYGETVTEIGERIGLGKRQVWNKRSNARTRLQRQMRNADA